MRYTKGPFKRKRPSRPATETALWYLGRRDMSRSELNSKLLFRGYEESEASEAIDKLAKLGLLNDLNFAKNYVRSSMLGRSKGKRRIVLELRRKGISDDDIENSFDLVWPEDDSEMIVKEAVRAINKNRLQTKEKVFQRSLAYLLRRGFPYDKAKKAVQENMD